MKSPAATKRRAPSEARQQFLSDVLSGLRQSPKRTPSKYFYDKRGSELFDRICQLEEYYPTRCELDIMEQYAPQMGAAIGPGAMLVEFGSGSSVKTRYLLDALPKAVAYVPVDISCEHLHQAAVEIAGDYPAIEVLPVCADFTGDFALPAASRAPTHTAVDCPGSTIGNLSLDRGVDLLRRIGRLCGRGGGLLIGIDLKKDVATIEAAYNDRDGVTAQFNLNLLRRMNRELGATFDLDQFSHRATYNSEMGRVETHLVSECTQVVTVGGNRFEFVSGETIATEHSHKYTVDEFAELASGAGLALRRHWTDRNGFFAVLHLVVEG